MLTRGLQTTGLKLSNCYFVCFKVLSQALQPSNPLFRIQFSPDIQRCICTT